MEKSGSVRDGGLGPQGGQGVGFVRFAAGRVHWRGVEGARNGRAVAEHHRVVLRLNFACISGGTGCVCVGGEWHYYARYRRASRRASGIIMRAHSRAAM